MEIPRVWVARLLMLPITALTLSAADPILGTWKLNLKQSKFVPGPGFKSETRSYEEQPDGIKVTIDTVDGKDRHVKSVYLTTADGKPQLVSGAGAPADSVALKRINTYTAE